MDTIVLTTEAALDRLIEKLTDRVERAERNVAEAEADNTLLTLWERGFRAASKLALEDAELIRSLTKRAVR